LSISVDDFFQAAISSMTFTNLSAVDREPHPFVRAVRSHTVKNIDSIELDRAQPGVNRSALATPFHTTSRWPRSSHSWGRQAK
jgi:hypothetical protein